MLRDLHSKKSKNHWQVMTELLGYQFFRFALIGVGILSVAAGILGCYIVVRRLVSLSGGITHSCFGGLGLGYYLGLSPIWLATVFAVASGLGVQALSRTGKVREDSAVAVIWAAGMAIGVFFVFMSPGAVPELNSFLFGNILTITASSLLMISFFTLALIAFVCCFCRKITACAFDPDFAQVSGLHVSFYNGVMMVFVAVGIVLMIRCVGMMLLMSMLTLPALVAELFTSRLSMMIPLSVAVSITGCVAGLFLAAAVNVPASALIVGVQVLIYALARIFARLQKIS